MKDNESMVDPKIQELLGQLSVSRGELSKYMADVDSIRAKVDQIFPTGQDFRNKWVLEEKVKAVSSFYSTLLNIRQEFNKTIKEEIEIRRKLTTDDSETEKSVDVRALAKMIEEEQKVSKDSEPKDNPPELKLQVT